MTIIIPTAPVLPPQVEAAIGLFFAYDRWLKDQIISFLRATGFVSGQSNLAPSSESNSCMQKLLGWLNNKTTLIFTQVTNQAPSTIKSPLDQLKLGDHFLKKPHY